MRRLPAVVAALAFLIAGLGLSAAAAAPPAGGVVDTGHVELSLIPGEDGIAPGSTIYVALKQTIDKGWHTYWRNPGDSGEATRIDWTLPAGWQSGPIVWATPQRLPVGPLMNYGYSDQVLLPVAITAPVSARVGETVRIDAVVDLLVCEEICIPERGKVSLELPVTAAPAPHPQWGARVARALTLAPKPAGLKATFARQGGGVRLSVTGAPLAGTVGRDAYFFAYLATATNPARPQRVERGPDGLTLTIVPGYAFQAPQPPATLAGVITADGKAWEIEAVPGESPAGAAGLGAPTASAPVSGGGGGGGLSLALAFAFLGGALLNLMPCVFPVLSMKAASLAGHAHEPRAARLQGLAFTGGVLAAFLALAGVLIAARAAGAAVGWGFQLQSPPVVAGLALLMLLIGLNLAGVYAVGASLQGVGSGLSTRRGLIGSALTGALAVIVAAPCTAPLMAGALGFALTQPAAVSLLVFAALGLGFAAPFFVLSMSPRLLGRLPKPGPWMETLRRILSFPMFAAAAWLVWVLTLQAGTTALAAVLAGGVLVALAAWLFGAWQRRAPDRSVRPTMAGLAALAAVLAAAVVIGGLRLGAVPSPALIAPDAAAAPAAHLASTPFSPDRLAALRAEGRPVFVNFTAAWCVTCQVNERAALSRKSVADAFTRTGAVYLKADWTRRDAVIARTLAEHGRAGVPLYLVYGRDPAAAPVVLPQLLTDGALISAIERAAATPKT